MRPSPKCQDIPTRNAGTHLGDFRVFFLHKLPEECSSLNKKLAPEMPLSKQTGCFKAQMILVGYVLEIQKDLEGFANLIMSILCYFSFFINLPLKQSVWILCVWPFLFSVLSSQHYSYFW